MKRMMWPHTLAFIAFLLIQNAVGQSNYASHANNVDYLGKGLPEEATLDGKVSIKIMESQKLSTASHAAISIGYHCRCLRKQNKKKITKKYRHHIPGKLQCVVYMSRVATSVHRDNMLNK